MISAAPQQEVGGKLVAFEGDADTISTQLRLLPPSQKILILPSLLESVPKTTDKQSFNARAFIREVHTAFGQRNETARSFLQSSTSTHPRLVFMNGGSVGARTACITAICENVTNGEIGEAEAIFDEIMKDGVAGLMKHEEMVVEDGQLEEVDESLDGTEESDEDPTVKAMKAADSLDRETAALQEDMEEDGARTENTNEDHRQSVSTFNYGDDIVTTVVTIPNRTEGAYGINTFGSGPLTTPFSAATYFTGARSYQSDDEEDNERADRYDMGALSPGEDSMFSAPTTPRVEYGEACIVDVHAVIAKNEENEVRRVRSMETFYPNNSRAQEIDLTPRKLNHTKSEYHLGGRPFTTYGRMEKESSPKFFQLPRTTFMRASKTNIKKSPSLNFSENSSSTSTPTVRVFQDRGIDAWEGPAQPSETKPEENGALEHPVFPVVEDMIVHFVNNASNEILESVIRSYKNGAYPMTPSPASLDAEYPPSSTFSNRNADESCARPDSHHTVETDDEGFHRRHEFDPYSDSSYPSSSKQWPLSDKLGRNHGVDQTTKPPTPTMTPPPQSNERFYEFSPVNPSSVIGVQNCLRSFLNMHFPAGENGYTQHYFSVTPEADRLWKPVFGNDQNVSTGNEGRTVDQIIALGCEDGVKKDFFAQISGQIERLGTKRNGLNRSARLDLRYLIANAMQTYLSLPHATQNAANPLTNPTLLATLLIPHLEAHLAINTSTRLLILIYPSNHLSTVVALRRLLGQDILKVAGILDSQASDPPTFGSRPRTPPNHPLSNEATSPKASNSHQHKRRDSLRSLVSHVSHPSLQHSKNSESSFSKANYLLPSTATDSEIATFLSSIWRPLAEKSAFYTPEPAVEPVVVEKVVEKIVEKIVEKSAPPQTPTGSSHPPVSYFQGRDGRDAKIARLTGHASDKRSHHYTPSITSTIRTTASERGRREVRERELEKAWEDFYIGEEDSEDDAYDRMVMGRAGARIVPEVVKQMAGKKRSSKKALKWLGLA